jgi:hypothetical protein
MRVVGPSALTVAFGMVMPTIVVTDSSRTAGFVLELEVPAGLVGV